MAGTASDRQAEKALIQRSESNTYYGPDTASKMKPGFTKARKAKDPGNTAAGTAGPSGRPTR